MSSVPSKTFSSSDICKIIASCGEHGVETLELGELKLSFLTKEVVPKNNVDSTSFVPSPPKALLEEIDEAYETDAFHIDNPLAFEEEMILGRSRDSEDAQ